MADVLLSSFPCQKGFFFPLTDLLFDQQYEWLVGAQYKPMELTKSDWAAIRKSPPWAIDSWGLGKVLPLYGKEIPNITHVFQLHVLAVLASLYDLFDT